MEDMYFSLDINEDDTQKVGRSIGYGRLRQLLVVPCNWNSGLCINQLLSLTLDTIFLAICSTTPVHSLTKRILYTVPRSQPLNIWKSLVSGLTNQPNRGTSAVEISFILSAILWSNLLAKTPITTVVLGLTGSLGINLLLVKAGSRVSLLRPRIYLRTLRQHRFDPSQRFSKSSTFLQICPGLNQFFTI